MSEHGAQQPDQERELADARKRIKDLENQLDRAIDIIARRDAELEAAGRRLAAGNSGGEQG